MSQRSEQLPNLTPDKNGCSKTKIKTRQEVVKMNDPQLKNQLEQARKEYQKLNKAILENDTPTLLLNYGCLKNANNRLNQLAFFLNHIEWKDV